MKKLLLIALLAISFQSFGQGSWSLSSAKNRWANGMGFGNKDTSAYTNASDTNIVVLQYPGVLCYRHLTTDHWKIIASYTGNGFLPISDTTAMLLHYAYKDLTNTPFYDSLYWKRIGASLETVNGTDGIRVNGGSNGTAAFSGQYFNHVLVSAGYSAGGINYNTLSNPHQVGFYSAISGNTNATGIGSFVAGFESNIGIDAGSLSLEYAAHFAQSNFNVGAGSHVGRVVTYMFNDDNAGDSGNVAIADQSTARSLTGNWFINYGGTRPSFFGGRITTDSIFTFNTDVQYSSNAGNGILSQNGGRVLAVTNSGISIPNFYTNSTWGSNTVTASSFIGNLSGNASTATKIAVTDNSTNLSIPLAGLANISTYGDVYYSSTNAPKYNLSTGALTVGSGGTGSITAGTIAGTTGSFSGLLTLSNDVQINSNAGYGWLSQNGGRVLAIQNDLFQINAATTYFNGGKVGIGTNSPFHKLEVSGGVYADSIIKSGGTSSQSLMADGSVQIVTSGTYTPTLTGLSNVASTTSALCQWLRIGNTVTVSGVISVTPTSTTTSTSLTVSLPISSNFSALTSCGGSGNWAGSPDNKPVAIEAIASGTTAGFYFVSDGVATARYLPFSFTYLIE